MSKVDELKKKYPKVSAVTLTKFTSSDNTPTKKYLEYYLKTWTDKSKSGCPNSSASLISVVKKFDELLPYIENKDIYSPEYSSFKNLKKRIDEAENLRDEKTFVKEEHITTIKETENYLMIRPKTHKGSCKYGASTKWCTAAKNYPAQFDNYTSRGLLIYVIRKSPTSNTNHNKIALYMNFSTESINSQVEIFAANDSRIGTNPLIASGWKEEELLEIFYIFRMTFIYVKKYKKAKDEVDGFISTISGLNFGKFLENLDKLEQTVDVSYISNIKGKLDILLNEIQTTTNVIRTTKN